MTELGEAPIEDIGEGPPEQDSDNPKAVVDENDKLEDFHPSTGWPDPPFPPPDPDLGPLIG
jgi:hypothetical protein